MIFCLAEMDKANKPALQTCNKHFLCEALMLSFEAGVCALASDCQLFPLLCPTPCAPPSQQPKGSHCPAEDVVRRLLTWHIRTNILLPDIKPPQVTSVSCLFNNVSLYFPFDRRILSLSPECEEKNYNLSVC